jgi:hypothetical protein
VKNAVILAAIGGALRIAACGLRTPVPSVR